MTVDANDRIVHLFLIHKDQIELIRRFPHVLFGDGTHYTNESDMPLYHLCGINAQNKTFSAAFCFMKKDQIKQEDYEWMFRVFKYFSFYHSSLIDAPTYVDLW